MSDNPIFYKYWSAAKTKWSGIIWKLQISQKTSGIQLFANNQHNYVYIYTHVILNTWKLLFLHRIWDRLKETHLEISNSCKSKIPFQRGIYERYFYVNIHTMSSPCNFLWVTNNPHNQSMNQSNNQSINQTSKGPVQSLIPCVCLCACMRFSAKAFKPVFTEGWRPPEALKPSEYHVYCPFLSDPGKPGVRYLGPDVRPSVCPSLQDVCKT